MSINGVPFDPWGWGWSIVGLLISIMIICLVVRIIIRIVHGDRYYCHHHHHHGHWDDFTGQDEQSSGARKILDERYAKGEISEEEYKKMRDNLK